MEVCSPRWGIMQLAIAAMGGLIDLKVAIVHYWLTGMRGGEAVLDALLDIYPDADLFTHVHDPAAVSSRISSRVVSCTFINRLPNAIRRYAWYLPLMPLALRLLDLSAYDLVISCESGPAKGVRVKSGAVHVCYCHSPMRYIWDQGESYLRTMNVCTAFAFRLARAYLRIWDRASAQKPDWVITNSRFVARRVKEYWGRDSATIFPPVDTARFSTSAESGDYYLYLGQLVAYKRPDLIVEAFNQSGRPLVVVGEGELLPALRRAARPNVKFMGRLSGEDARQMMAGCRALLYAGVEDFGIAPVEAMAAGRPVIAYADGGLMETVVEGITGIFFRRQDVAAINDAIVNFEARSADFDPQAIVADAQRFCRPPFLEQMAAFMQEKLPAVGAG